MEIKTMYDYRKYANYEEYVDDVIKKNKQEKAYWEEAIRQDATQQKIKLAEKQQKRLQSQIPQQWQKTVKQAGDWAANTYDKATNAIENTASYFGYGDVKDSNKNTIIDTTKAHTMMARNTATNFDNLKSKQDNPFSRISKVVKQKYPAKYPSSYTTDNIRYYNKQLQQRVDNSIQLTNKTLENLDNFAKNPLRARRSQTITDIDAYFNYNNDKTILEHVEQNNTQPTKHTRNDISEAAQKALDYVLRTEENTTAACNIGVRETFKTLYNSKLLDNKKANDMANYWGNDTTGIWEEVEIMDVQELANQGHFVVACWENTDSTASGHVVVIVPGEAENRKWNYKQQDVPNSMETGGEKKRWLSKPITNSFGSPKQPNVKFYLYNPL